MRGAPEQKHRNRQYEHKRNAHPYLRPRHGKPPSAGRWEPARSGRRHPPTLNPFYHPLRYYVWIYASVWNERHYSPPPCRYPRLLGLLMGRSLCLLFYRSYQHPPQLPHPTPPVSLFLSPYVLLSLFPSILLNPHLLGLFSFLSPVEPGSRYCRPPV